MTFIDILDIPIITPNKVVEEVEIQRPIYSKTDALKNAYRAKRSNIINKGKKNVRK